VKVVAHYPYNRAHSPSSNLHSNVVDMARWATASLNHREPLKSSTYNLMWTPDKPDGPATAVGLSWFVGDINGNRCVFHNGGDDGFISRLVVFPDLKRTVFYMTNCDFADMKAIDSIVMDTVLAPR